MAIVIVRHKINKHSFDLNNDTRMNTEDGGDFTLNVSTESKSNLSNSDTKLTKYDHFVVQKSFQYLIFHIYAFE